MCSANFSMIDFWSADISFAKFTGIQCKISSSGSVQSIEDRKGPYSLHIPVMVKTGEKHPPVQSSSKVDQMFIVNFT